MQFANTDRLKENYSIDTVIHYNVIDCIKNVLYLKWDGLMFRHVTPFIMEFNEDL